ncbi:DUF5684 domain-containing protein [Microbacterium sp. NPDC076911]|uniref:DUF5684 domain-containing protein n=1 Tax=Microbacterium sp. NPDC076911 TaxID=3154958 RepID=UPI00342B0926
MTLEVLTPVLFGPIPVVVAIGIYVWTALALGAVFRKSGDEAWNAWVPVYNQVILLRLGGLSPWLLLFWLIPGLGWLAVWIAQVIACHHINLAFGVNAAMTALAALLFPVWAAVLGFGSARWLGAGERRALDASVPRPAYARQSYVDHEEVSSQPNSVDKSSTDAHSSVDPPPTLSWAPEPEGAKEEPVIEDESDWLDTDTPSDAPAPMPAMKFAPTDPASLPEGVLRGRGGAILPTGDTSDDLMQPPVTRVPAASAAQTERDPWAPSDPEAFPETSGPVSAVVGAPAAGLPRAARTSVSASHTRPEIPEDVLDETIIARRRRTNWSIVLPTGEPVALGSTTVLLGRRPAADPQYPTAQLVSIDDGTVSKTHARLELKNDRWFITDLASTNGVVFATLVGTEVEASPGEETEAGDRFMLGDAEVRLVRSDW